MSEWLYIGTIAAGQSILISIINSLDTYVGASLTEAVDYPKPSSTRSRRVAIAGLPLIVIHTADQMREMNTGDWTAGS